MIAVIHQPNYLPGLTYFDKLRLADVFVLLDTAQFPKNNWTNRNRIKTPTGAQWLTVPVATTGASDQAIRETRTVQDRPWERKHWNSLRANYGKAPAFEEVASWLESVYTRRWPWLAALNEHLIKSVAASLGLATPIIRASDLTFEGQSTDALVSICQAVGASTYLSGPGGRAYMEDERFTSAGIEVVFHDFTHPIYPQLFGEFLPNMSVLDLLFNLGSEAQTVWP